MINRKRFIYQILFFIFLICCTFYLLLKDVDIQQIYTIFKNLQYRYVIIGILFALAYVMCESVSFKIIFNTLNVKTKFIHLIRYSFIGFYFSAITPSASGGQPMQIYYMKKDNIEYAHSSIAVLLCVMSYQAALIILFLLAFIYKFNFLQAELSTISIIVIIGIIVNTCLLLFFMGMIFSKKLLPNIINAVLKFLAKIRIVKDLEKAQEKINTMSFEYQRSAQILRKNPGLLFKILCIYFTQLIIRFSISYFAACAMRIHNGTYFDFISIQAIILFCVSSLPLPGGVGISETLYITLFTTLIPVELLSSAAIITQTMNYYIIVIIATFIVIYSHFRYNK